MNTETLKESPYITLDADKLPLVVPPETDFDETGEGQDFLAAPELEKIANQLIEKHSKQFGHLATVNIVFLWKKKGGQSSGKNILGKTQSAAGLVRYFGNNVDFVIWAAADHLGQGDGMLPRRTAEALMFHELCHIAWDPDKGKIRLVGHDWAGFSAEVAAYGIWDENLAQAAETFEQLSLKMGQRQSA